MYKHSERPTRKCGKCKLNFKTSCGLFDNPHAMWADHRKCPGHLSEEHYQQYLEQQRKAEEEQASKQPVFQRRQEAKLRQTETHHNGLHINRS